VEVERKGVADRRQAYVIVNNRLEGNAPLTIQALMNVMQASGSGSRAQERKPSSGVVGWLPYTIRENRIAVVVVFSAALLEHLVRRVGGARGRGPEWASRRWWSRSNFAMPRYNRRVIRRPIAVAVPIATLGDGIAATGIETAPVMICPLRLRINREQERRQYQHVQHKNLSVTGCYGQRTKEWRQMYEWCT